MWYARLATSRLYVVSTCLMTLLIWVGVIRGVHYSLSIPPGDIKRELGHAYMARVPTHVYRGFRILEDANDTPSRSVLDVFEDDRKLGPRHSQHQDIRGIGKGRLSHWGEWVYFSATDNSSPSDNGRSYRVDGYATLPSWIAFAVLMITLGHLVVLVRVRTLARPDVPPLPSLLHANLNRVVLVAFLLAIASYVPSLLAAAARGDEKWQHAIPITLGDDNAYQILAVNVLHGLGYAERLLLPVEEYRLEEYRLTDSGPETASSLPQFRRAPGLALMLAASYKVFGPETIVARRTMAVLAWLTALCLLLTGSVMAGWIGSVAGGLTALYHLNYFSGMYNLERLLSENPTAFWVALFGLTFTLFLRRNRSLWLVMSALSLAAVILMRANFIIALPLLALYLAGVTRRRRPVALFVTAALMPLLLWSAYASLSTRSPVFVTVAGPRLFAHTNNADTLEGLGPERWNQGGWNPGSRRKADGTWEVDYHNQLQPGESGWRRGLTFWWNNLPRMPELFFIKLRAGLWFNNGLSENWLRPEGFYLIGIGYLVMAIGFLPFTIARASAFNLRSQPLLVFQLVLIAGLCAVGNRQGLLPVLLIWGALLGVSLLRLSGRQQPMGAINPAWFLAFVVTHALTTMIFYGIRFNRPLDSSLLLICLLGILLTLYETARRTWWLPLSFAGVIVITVLQRVY